MGSDKTGVNAMSVSEITNIPRPTVVRKLKYLLDNKYVKINKKKLYSLNIHDKKNMKAFTKLQELNIISLSNFMIRSFNGLKIN